LNSRESDDECLYSNPGQNTGCQGEKGKQGDSVHTFVLISRNKTSGLGKLRPGCVLCAQDVRDFQVCCAQAATNALNIREKKESEKTNDKRRGFRGCNVVMGLDARPSVTESSTSCHTKSFSPGHLKKYFQRKNIRQLCLARGIITLLWHRLRQKLEAIVPLFMVYLSLHSSNPGRLTFPYHPGVYREKAFTTHTTPPQIVCLLGCFDS